MEKDRPYPHLVNRSIDVHFDAFALDLRPGNGAVVGRLRTDVRESARFGPDVDRATFATDEVRRIRANGDTGRKVSFGQRRRRLTSVQECPLTRPDPRLRRMMLTPAITPAPIPTTIT